MRILILSLIIFTSFANLSYSSDLYKNEFVGSKQSLSDINNIHLCIFKPSRLILSQDNKILIKGIPGHFVSLAYSKSYSGANLTTGQKASLGDDLQTIEGEINDKGFIELNLNLSANKFNEGDNLYFELVSWSYKDYSDLQQTEIYGTDGKTTNSNSIIVVNKISNTSMPMFGPAIPGLNANFNDAVDAIKNINNSSYNNNYQYPNEMYYEKPSMFLNINAPELQRK